MNAAVAREALALFIQGKLPTVPGAGPEPPVTEPTLAEISSLMRAVAVHGIARSTRFDDYAFLTLLDFHEFAVEPVHIFRFHEQKALHQRLVYVWLAIQPYAKGERKLFPSDGLIENAPDLP